VASFWRISIATFLALIVLYKIFVPDRPAWNEDEWVSGIHLRQIDVALALYEAEHDGRLPDELKGPVAKAELPPETLHCPASRIHHATIHGAPEYLYLGAGWRRKEMPVEQIIACEPFAASAADRNETVKVLTAVGIESISIPEVEKRIRDAAIRLNNNKKAATSRP
jgi:hypothetical protein